MKNDCSEQIHCCLFTWVKTHYDGNKGISEIYGKQLALPKIPLVHPYYPDGTDRNIDGRPTLGIPSVPLTMHLPANGRHHLPQAVQDELECNEITDDCLKIFFVAQNYPWAFGTALLFCPHYGMHPDARGDGTYNKTR